MAVRVSYDVHIGLTVQAGGPGCFLANFFLPDGAIEILLQRHYRAKFYIHSRL